MPKKKAKEEADRDNKDKEQTNRGIESARKGVRIIFGVILLVFILLIVLVTVGFSIVMFFQWRDANSNQSGNDIGNYLTIFSILFTLLALTLPLTSYIINKDEIKKINDSVGKKIENADENVNKNIAESKLQIEEVNKRHSEEVNAMLYSLDVRYVELLECIVRHNDIVLHGENDPYICISLDYINALMLFENGSYNECKIYIGEAIKKMNGLSSDNPRIDCQQNRALLVYKLFDLLRKVSGRTRSFDGLLLSIEDFTVQLREQGVKDKPLYRATLYIYIKSWLDETEKTFKTDEVKLQEMRKLIKGLSAEVDYFSLEARLSFVEAYYYGRKACYELAIGFAKDGKDAFERNKKNSKKDEIEKLIETDSIFAIARVFEKSSFCVTGNERNKLLESAYNIVDELIEEKPSAKFYLELSEILKKQGKNIESDNAAQYGFQMAPCDPLLAAQCAYVYLRRYFVETSNLCYIGKAEECIEIAHWIYRREKEKYNDHINVKFSYIASLYALIKTVVLTSTKDQWRDNQSSAILTEIEKSLRDSIIDNPNNVPNYRRAFIIYSLLYERNKSKEAEIFYYEKVVEYIRRFQQNVSFKFNNDDEFFIFADNIMRLRFEDSSKENLLKEIRRLVEPFEKNI